MYNINKWINTSFCKKNIDTISYVLNLYLKVLWVCNTAFAFSQSIFFLIFSLIQVYNFREKLLMNRHNNIYQFICHFQFVWLTVWVVAICGGWQPLCAWSNFTLVGGFGARGIDIFVDDQHGFVRVDHVIVRNFINRQWRWSDVWWLWLQLPGAIICMPGAGWRGCAQPVRRCHNNRPSSLTNDRYIAVINWC